jgi:ketosteroid isomerase-like protein
MTFRETLEKHLSAIQEKNLPAFGETVAQDEIILITADGRLVMSPQELLEMHNDWFAMDGWNLEVNPVQVYETPEMGVAVLRLLYSEDPEDRPAVREESLLTLIFRQRGGEWRMVQDQNTPVKVPVLAA